MSARSIAGSITGGVLCAMLLMAGCSAAYTVDAGETAVVTMNGAVVETVGPGLHFKMPFVQGANTISNQDHTLTFKDLTLQTKDRQVVHIDLALTFQVNDAGTLYSKFQTLENLQSRIIDPQGNSVAVSVFGQYDASGLVDQADAVNVALKAAVIDALTEAPVTVKTFQVRRREFTPEYTKAIADQQQAQVRAKQAEYEKLQKITEADAKAYGTTAEADAKAHATEVAGLADAKAIEARGKALRDNPALVQLNAVDKWNGALPTTMPPGATVPFLNLGK